MSNDELYKAALESVRRLFMDRSVPEAETCRKLKDLQDEIGIMMIALGRFRP